MDLLVAGISHGIYSAVKEQVLNYWLSQSNPGMKSEVEVEQLQAREVELNRGNRLYILCFILLFTNTVQEEEQII